MKKPVTAHDYKVAFEQTFSAKEVEHNSFLADFYDYILTEESKGGNEPLIIPARFRTFGENYINSLTF